MIRGLGDAGLDVSREFFPFRSDDQVVCWQMVRAGLGVGSVQTVLGDADSLVEGFLVAWISERYMFG